MKRAIFAEIAALQTDGNGVFDAQSWADFGALGSRLAKAGVAWKTCELGSNFTAFMEAAFRDEAERGEIAFGPSKAGTDANLRVRLTQAPTGVAKSAPQTVKPTPSAPPVESQKLSDAEVEKRVLAAFQALQTGADGKRDARKWVERDELAKATKAAGVNIKLWGYSNFSRFLAERFSRFSYGSVGGIGGRRIFVYTKIEEETTSDAAQKEAESGASQPKKLSDAEIEKRFWAAMGELQTDAEGKRDASGWAALTRLGSRFKNKGVDVKALGYSTLAKFLQARFAERLEFESEGTCWRVRPKNVASAPSVEAKETPGPARTGAAESASVSTSSIESQKLSDKEIEKRVLEQIVEIQTDKTGVCDATKWVDFANLCSRLKQSGLDFKESGSANFADFMKRFAEKLTFQTKKNVWRTRLKTASTAVVPIAENPSIASTVPKKETPVPQTPLSDAELEKRVLAALRALQKDGAGRRDPSAWVDFTVLGPRLKANGVDYKAFDRASYAKLLEARFSETLQFDKSESTAWRVRPTLAPNKDDAELADWAVVAPERFDELAKLALPEKWRFDDAEPAPGESRYPILESYLKYTFRQLAFEEKVKIAPAEDVAAFNTGLFDRKFDPIFAFFRKNVGPEPLPWRLSSFAVVAQDADGKELVARFEPLPERARFFERREDLVFDGDAAIRCDGEHCLVENVARLPSDFLRRYCSAEFLTLKIDGETRTLDDVADKPEKDPTRRQYFKALEKKLPDSSELFEMKLRFDAAIELAKKRVAANFRTAVPSFNPRKRNVCYLLPLTLTARREASECADVALVVERLPETGVYQGHTVYTLDMAYKTARLTSRLGGENWLDG